MFMMDEYRTSRVKYIKKSKEGIGMLMDVQALRELAGEESVLFPVQRNHCENEFLPVRGNSGR